MTAKDALRAAMDANHFRMEHVSVQTGLGVRTVAKILKGGQVKPATLMVLHLVPGFSERYHGERVAS